MATIAGNLTRLAEIKEDIRQAINDKGVEVTTAVPFTAYADKIAEIPQGGERVDAPMLDVNFYDYDGWRCYSYSKEDFLALTAMPEQPQNEGLIAQGWNWTLSDAQSHVRKYKQLEIGAFCVADETRLYLEVTHDNYEVYILLRATQMATTVIDWGDGSRTTGVGQYSTPHTYVKSGNYVVTILTAEGQSIQLGNGSDSYCIVGETSNRMKNLLLVRVDVGENVSSLLSSCFYNCRRLQTVNTPKDIVWGNNIYTGTWSVNYVTIPANAGTYLFRNSELVRVSCSHGITNIQALFYSSHGVLRVTLPDSVTTIGNLFMSEITQIYSMYIPDSVTSVGSNSFYWSDNLKEIRVYPTTPPTIQANSFGGTLSSTTIYVPHGCLEAYQAATNWAAYASRMVEMEEEI